MANQPNIFNYATSELTQDAFITWLLQWAHSDYCKVNQSLHQLGLDFLKSLLAKNNIDLQAISNLEIKQQYHKIDVFVRFEMQGKEYAIIIEDKVHSIDHSNQLDRYKKKVKELKVADIIVPIYFKTGYQVNFKRIVENGYYHYSVKDFLRVISHEKVKEINNDVLTQYHSYLLKKNNDYDWADKQANNYTLKPIGEWTWWSSVRFFHEYKTAFHAGWGSVPNSREPLLAFWFGGRTFIFKGRKLEIYMDIQFKHDNIEVSYRLGLFNTQLKDISVRNNVFNAFMPYLKENNIKAKKPKFTPAKQTILLANISNLDRSLLYLDFVKQIEAYQNILNAFVEEQNAKEI